MLSWHGTVWHGATLMYTVSKGCMEMVSYVPWREGCTLLLHRQCRLSRQSTCAAAAGGPGGRAQPQGEELRRGTERRRGSPGFPARSLPSSLPHTASTPPLPAETGRQGQAGLAGLHSSCTAGTRGTLPHLLVLGHERVNVVAARHDAVSQPILAHDHHSIAAGGAQRSAACSVRLGRVPVFSHQLSLSCQPKS